MVRGRLGRDDEVIADVGIAAEDEELAVLEGFEAEDVAAVLVVIDGFEDTISPFSKKTPFL